MATNTPNTAARELHTQQTHYLRKRIAFDDVGLTGIAGILPAGALILRGNVYVTTAFNAGVLDIGIQGGAADAYSTDLALSQAIVPFDALAITNSLLAVDTVLTFARSATAASGEGFIVVEYVVNNDH